MICFVMALHNHQPVGNFDHVFEDAHNKCYRPFLDVFSRYDELRISLHFSGVLLEWIRENHPPTFDLLGRMVSAGRVEMLTGGFYEPILVMLPDEDRLGQIQMLSEYLQKHLGAKCRGAWLAERVWEQSLVSTLADAGVEYTLLDDSHFKFAGIEGERLRAYFVTEDRGRLIKVLPMDERLRYLVPFHPVEETIEYLRAFDAEGRTFLLTYADDGEKFGTWPGTHDYIYGERWLERFLDALRANSSWIKIMTAAEAVDALPPSGKTYLPEASYREMMEWVLPARVQCDYRDFCDTLNAQGLFESNKFFVKGSTWRSFLAKYPESEEMYGRMMGVSRRLARRGAKAPDEARRELYMAQCNCPYWHGIFGGLYLPHLRFAIYKHLINAESMLLPSGGGVTVEREDLNFDGLDEIHVITPRQGLLFKPHAGAHLYEWDVRPIGFNATNSLSRRPEAYHREILNPPDANAGGVKSIHEGLRLKQEGLAEKLRYDRNKRECLVEHFLAPDATPKDFETGEYEELGDFVEAAFSAASKGKSRVELTFEATRSVATPAGPTPLRLAKRIRTDGGRDGFSVDYELENLGEREITARFLVEWSFSMLAGDAPDRFFFSPEREDNVGPLIAELALAGVRRFGIRDDWQRLDIVLTMRPASDVWTFPVQTVSQSEGGTELVYQASTVAVSRPIRLAAGRKTTIGLDAAFAVE